MRKNLHKNKKSGQGTVEWILILAVIVGLVAIFGKTLKGQIGSLVDNVFKTVNGKVTDLGSDKP